MHCETLKTLTFLCFKVMHALKEYFEYLDQR